MASLVLNGATSGAITVSPAAVAGSNTVTIPARTGNVMMDGPLFMAYGSGAQTINTGSYTKVTFATEEYDTAACFDNATNYRFTPNVAGYYQFNWYISTTTVGVTRLITYLYKNGVGDRLGSDFSCTNALGSGGSSLVYLNGSTDYVELYGQPVGANAALGTTGSTRYFQGYLVRAA